MKASLKAKLDGYKVFLSRSYEYMDGERLLFSSVVGLSLLVALSETISVAMLVPILQSIGDQSIFSSIPILRHIDQYFIQFETVERLQIAAGFILLIVLVKGVMTYTLSYISSMLGLRVGQRLRVRSFNALLDASMAFINSFNVGELSNCLSGYGSRVASAISILATMCTSLFTFLIYFVMMLLISWKMTIGLLVFVMVLSSASRLITSGPLLETGREVSRAGEAMGRVTYETLYCMKMIHLAVAERYIDNAHFQALRRQYEADRRYTIFSNMIGTLFSVASGAAVSALLYISISFNFMNEQEIVSIILFFIYISARLLGPVSAINSARAGILGQMDAFEKLTDFYVRAKLAIQPNGDKSFESLKYGIEFKNVNFAYDGKEGEVLRDVSFHIPRGAMVAFVGPSGAGKTTVVGLLTRLYDATGGAIEIDGVNLRDFDVKSWRRKTSVVSQDIIILNDTVSRNIAFGHENDVSMERIERAARLSASEEFIAKMADGYETILGERGCRLSGGQQQRLAIARAILNDPDVIILDEATSHLDSISEREIQKSIELLRKDRTVLVIAHRLSTIKKADIIIVLNDGRIAESGSHETLQANKGMYWDLLQHQRLDLIDENEVQS